MTKKHRISFRLDDADYQNLMVVAAHTGKLPGPYVHMLTLKAAEKGKALKGRCGK